MLVQLLDLCVTLQVTRALEVMRELPFLSWCASEKRLPLLTVSNRSRFNTHLV